MMNIKLMIAAVVLVAPLFSAAQTTPVEEDPSVEDKSMTICLSVTMQVLKRHIDKRPPYTQAEISRFVITMLSPKLTYMSEELRPIVQESFELTERLIGSGKSEEEISLDLTSATVGCLLQVQDKMEKTPAPTST